MKKLFTLLLLLSLLSVFSGCFGKTDDAGQTTSLEELTEAPVETTEANTSAPKESIDLKYIVENFDKKDVRAVFNPHLEEYDVVSGPEISSFVLQKTWNIVMILSYGSWSGQFHFNEDGTIRETIYDGSEGYFNNRRWYVSGDALVLSSEKENEKFYEIRSLGEYGYVGVLDGTAQLVIY